VAKRPIRRDLKPEAPSIHEYLEHAADWVLEYKFTVAMVAVLAIALLVYLSHRGRAARADETGAWQTFRGSQNAEDLRLALPELKDTSAYPWAAIRLGTLYYWDQKYDEAIRVVEPVVRDPEVAEVPRAFAYHLLGCAYAEAGDTDEAKVHLKKALTYGKESPYLQGLTQGTLQALKDWPPAGLEAEETSEATQPSAQEAASPIIGPAEAAGNEEGD